MVLSFLKYFAFNNSSDCIVENLETPYWLVVIKINCKAAD